MPRPKQKPENEERYGQYYFRDQILDQLDRYFLYLKRLRHASPADYELHRRLGIHVVPGRTIQTFDDWRFEGTNDELDAWWKENRPGFGAVAYGIDEGSDRTQTKMATAVAPPEQWKEWEKTGKAVAPEAQDRELDRLYPAHRIATMTGGGTEVDGANGVKYKTGIAWVPKFLIFTKWAKVPSHIQRVADGDVYSLTIYWDRLDDRSKNWHKRGGKRGGVPQEYAVCVEKTTGKIRILKMLLRERVTIQHRHGPNRGETSSIPHNHWGVPIKYLSWATGHLRGSPEDILRRTFIEAAMLYQSASLGSMIRIEATKGSLTATFGVEVKRMAYFFRDRDITARALTQSGRRKPIFHIVRPHIRHTKHGEKAVPMHFSGLKEFDWAGYKIIITVPGRDHLHLTDFDMGVYDKRAGPKGDLIGPSKVGEKIKNAIREGKGAWK